jgi:hypothetical protein
MQGFRRLPRRMLGGKQGNDWFFGKSFGGTLPVQYVVFQWHR